jgi:chromosome segregation ATPase
MSSLPSLIRAAATLAIVMGGSTAAHGQTARSGSGANAQLLQQLQQLASDRTALQVDNARMKKELDDARKERDELKRKQQAVDQRAKASAAELVRTAAQRQAAEQELNQTKAKTQELIAKFRETAQTLRQLESQDTTAKQTLARRDQELKVCIDRNLALYKLNGEVLTHLEHDSAWSHLARAEPFTKIKRVELENLVDDYKARAADERVDPGRAPPPAPAPQAPPGAATPAPQADGAYGK